MEPIVALVLAAAIAAVGAVPLSPSSQCSQSCVVVDDGRPPLVAYSPTQTYFYAFESKSQFKSVQLGLSADVELSPLTPCELQLVLSNVQLDDGLDADPGLRASLEQPLVFAYAGGRVESVCPSSADSLESLNMKKALISLLQMSAKSATADSVVLEQDVLGECDTRYSPSQSSSYYSSSMLVMRKQKDLSACRRRQSADFALFPRAYGFADEYVSRQSAPLMNASLQCEQTIQTGVITGVTCFERQTPFWSSQPLIQSQLSLRLLKQVAGVRTAIAPEFRTPHKLLMAFDHKYAAPASDQLAAEADITQTLRQTCAAIDGQHFEQTVVPLFRQLVVRGAQLSPSAVKRLDSSLRSGQLCSSPKAHDLFVDAMTLSATEASLQPLVDAVTNGRMGDTRSAYLFSLLAFSSSGSQSALNTLLPLLQSRHSSRQLVLAVSAFVHNLEHSQDHAFDSAPIDRVIELIVARVQSGQSPIDTIAAIKALGNIAHVQHNARAKQTLVSLATDSSADSSVRSAAIQALVSADAVDTDIRQRLLSSVFEQKSQSNEVRIHAYKAIVMSGASRATLERIRAAIQHDEDEHVSNYVRSHQKNVRASSDPSKHDVLPSGAPEFSPPQSSSLTVAQNLEFSYVSELANAGVVLESDLIYAREARVPRSVSLNVSIPLFGKQLNVIEVTLRQKGFADAMQALVDKLARFGKEHYTQIWREMQHFFESNSISNSFRASDSSFELFVKVDGKSVLVLDLLRDLSLARDLFEQFQRMAEQLKNRVTVERAFATLFLDSSIRVPLATGIPFALKLNGTVVSALSANVKVDVSGGQTSVVDLNVRPSFVAEISSGIEMQSKSRKNSAKPLKFVNRFSFSPLIDVKAERIRRSFHFSVNVPNERQSLFKIESLVHNELNPSYASRDANGVSTCSGSALGVSICQQISFKNGVSFEAFVKKNDKSMKGVELSIEAPDDYNDDTKRWRMAFNTPHSSVNREMSVELQMSSQSAVKREIRLQLQSPYKQLLASLSLRNEERERFVQMEVTSDGQQMFSLDVGLQNQTRGQKRELRPRVRVQWQGQREPIVLTGAVSVSRGRKNQISIQLENANSAHKQYFKGSVVREKSDARAHNADMRVSGDLSLVLSDLIETRVSAVVDKTPKYALSDLTVEYKLRKWSRKEVLKMSAKVQNLTQSALHKLSAYADLTSSQFAALNANFSYNLLQKSNEYVENELSFGFARKQLLHALQTTKYANDASGRKMDTTVSVRATPLNIDYEVRATGLYDQSKPQYSLDLLAKDRLGRKERDLKAQLNYRHVSRSPLHVLVEMSAKRDGRELAYRDEVRETAAGEYKGQTFVQWARGRSATLDYLYRTRSDGYPRASQHELEAELKSSRHAYPVKHVAVLKMSRDAFELKSKTHAGGQQLYALETALQRSGPSRVQLDVSGLSGKLYVDPYSRPQTASIEVSASDGRYHHKSDAQFDALSSLAFKSDTKRNQQNVLAIDALLHRDASPSRVVIASQPFDARLDVIGGQKYAFEMQAKRSAIAHSSQLTNDVNGGRRVVTFKSETKSNYRPLLVIDGQYAPKQKHYINVDAPALGLLNLDASLPARGQRSVGVIVKSRSGAEHSTRADWSRANADFLSNSIAASGLPVLNVKYTKRDQSHAFSLDTPSFESRLSSPDSRDVTFGLVSKPYQLTHDTSVAFKPHGLSIDSQTNARNANLAKVSALLSRHSPSTIHVLTPQTMTRLGFEPYKSAKLEFDSPLNSLNHVTQLSYANDAFAIDSHSRAHDQDYIVNGVLSAARESSLATKFPAFDSSLRFDKQSNSAKFDFTGKRAPNAYSHVSEAQFAPHEYTLKSQTSRDGQHVLSLDALLANRRSPSTLAVKYGAGSEANIRVMPYSSIGVDARHKQYSHATEVEFDKSANSVTVKSRTDKPNENLNKINAYFTPKFDQKSHLFISSPKSNYQFEIEPQNSVKVEVRAHPYEHKSDARLRPTPAFVSTTTKSGQTLLNVNSAIGARSFVRVESPLANGGLFVDDDSAKFELHAPNTLQHESTVRVIRPNGLTIDSASNWSSGKRFANVNARLSNDYYADANRVSMDTHAFESSLDVNGRKAQFDFRSKLPAGRHVLAAIAAPKAGFEVNVEWDRARDASKRVELVLRADDHARDTRAYSMRALFGASQVKALAEVNARDAMRGPNALTLEWIPSASGDESVSVKVEHAMSGASMTCGLSYAVDGEKQFGAKLIGSRTPNAVKVKVSADSPNDKAFDFEFDADLRRQSPNKYSADISALTGISAKHSLKIELQKQDNDYFGSMSGSVAVESPSLATPSKLDFDWNRKQKSFQTNFFARNSKQFEAHAKLLDTSYGLTLDVISNIESIPSIKALLSLDTSGKAVVVTLDQNGVRVLDINSKLNSKNGINADFRLNDALSVSVKTKHTSDHMVYSLLVTRAANQLLDIELSLKSSVGNAWTASGHIVANGAELARASIGASPAANALQYALRAQSSLAKAWSPLVIEASKKSNARELQYAIDLSSRDKQALKGKLHLMFGARHNYYPESGQLELNIPEQAIDATLEYALNAKNALPRDRYETSLLDASGQQKKFRTTGDYQTKLVVRANGHAFGFDARLPERSRNGYDAEVHVFLPSGRKMTIRTDVTADHNSLAAKADLQNDGDHADKPLLSGSMHIDTGNGVTAHVSLSSPKFRRNPKTISLISKQSTDGRPLDIKIELDVTSNPKNALTISAEAAVTRLTGNRTATLTIASRDKQLIDLYISGHVSQDQSAGITWHNRNRNGKLKSGFVAIERQPTSSGKAFLVTIADQYSIRAQISADHTYASTVTFTSLTSRKSTSVHTQVSDGCATFDVRRDWSSDSSALKLCADFSASHVMSMSAESTANGEKTLDLSTRLDTRGAKTLKVVADWSPAVVRELLQQLADNAEHWPELDSELLSETAHKVSVIAKQAIDEAVIPVTLVLFDQIEAEVQALARQWPPLNALLQHVSLNYNQMRAKAEEALDAVASFVHSVTPDAFSDAVDAALKSGSRAARRLCSRHSDTCYQYLFAFDKYGIEGVAKLFAQKVYELARQTHRVTIQSFGKLSSMSVSMPSIGESRIAVAISRAIGDAIDAAVDRVKRAIANDEDARQLVAQLEALGASLSAEFDAIDWHKVKHALSELASLLFSRQSWQSSSRVLVFEPERGHVEIELHAPIVRSSHHLKAVMTRALPQTTSWSSWFTRASQPEKMVRALWIDARLVSADGGTVSATVAPALVDGLRFAVVVEASQLTIESRVHNDRTLRVSLRSLEWSSSDTSDHWFSVAFVSANSVRIELFDEKCKLELNSKRQLIVMETNVTDDSTLVLSSETEATPLTPPTHNVTSDLCSHWFARNGSQMVRACESARDTCHFGALMTPHVPRACMTCDTRSAFGERAVAHVSRDSADVLFVLSCGESSAVRAHVTRLARELRVAFDARAVRSVRFLALVNTRDDHMTYLWPKFETLSKFSRHVMSTSDMWSRANLTLSLDWLSATVTSLPFRPDASHHVIIVKCSACREQHIDFVSARHHLLSRAMFAHVILFDRKRLVNEKRAKKWRQVIGYDADHVFMRSRVSSAEMRRHVKPLKDVCVAVAMETNGTVFSRANTRAWRQTVSARIASNHVPNACLACDCIESADHVTPRTDCRLCESREATIGERGETDVDDDDSSQEWTDDDEDVEEEVVDDDTSED